MTTKRLFTTICSLALTLSMAWAQGPNGSEYYYQAADGLKGAALKTAMYNIIKNPSVKNYENLTDYYPQTDKRTDGKVRDRYSNITNYTFSQCTGNYSKEGDMYNKEHSFPKSWFGGKVTPMYSDLFHVIPADGYVNNRRGNVPFGTTNGNVYTSANDYSKVGDCTYSGYTGTVFEPDDEWKGDFARIYFYMVTCYEDKVATWINNATSTDKSVIAVLNGTKYPAFTDWQKSLLLEWSRNDPVSEIEIARNTAVYNIQKNRNPFVDYPGLEEYIWGTKTSESFDYTSGGSGGSVTTVANPTFSPAGGTFTTAQIVTISCSTSGAIIYYTTNGSTPSTSSTMYNGPITISETTTLKAIAIKDGTQSNVATATYTIGGDEPMPTGNGSFTKVTSTSQLVAGYEYIFVAETSRQVMNSTAKTTYFEGSDVDISNNTIAYDESMLVLTLGGSNGAWTFRNGSNFLVSTGAKKVSLSSSSATWTISTATFTATPKTSSYGTLQYNAASPRFTTYTSTQEAAVLYYRIPKTTTPGDIVKDGKIDWNDLKALVKILLGITPAGENIDSDAADVNGDGETNIADVTKLVNKILQTNK